MACGTEYIDQEHSNYHTQTLSSITPPPKESNFSMVELLYTAILERQSASYLGSELNVRLVLPSRMYWNQLCGVSELKRASSIYTFPVGIWPVCCNAINSVLSDSGYQEVIKNRHQMKQMTTGYRISAL